ncbi:MAG: Transferase [uncultured Sulfurovum sp.]|uniref:Transferase n=1 Tax=uncultured Sulfurovum sp. TaxID=269237 RepID=A0A6S6T9H9_9BACT|nr:MAG: Transferase [uncultured Sulfurovum sp.]
MLTLNKREMKSTTLVGLIHALDLGGAERIMVRVLNYFVGEGYDVHLIIFDHRGALKDELSREVMLHDLAIPSVMRGMPKCLKTLKNIEADIIFTGIGHLNIALAPFIPLMRRFLPKSKWVSRETNIVSLHNKISKYPKLFDWLYQHTYRNYDHIIAQSKDMKEDLEKNYFFSEKIVVINNPIDFKKIQYLSNKEVTGLFDKTKINLLSVSGLRIQKRHDLMLKTLVLLPKNYHLTIVGTGETEENLKHLSKYLNINDQVSFVGQQSNPYVYMKEADILILTSEREGFPNVLLEANTLGLPIVAFSCVGGIKEIIKEGVNGFYSPFGECELLAENIEKASSFSFEKDKIIRTTINKYSQENILEKYKKLFKDEL